MNLNFVGNFSWSLLSWFKQVNKVQSDQDLNEYCLKLASDSFNCGTQSGFASLLKDVHSLYSSSPSRSLIICKTISKKIDLLISITENKIDELQIKEKSLSNQLIFKNQIHTRIYQSYQQNLLQYKSTSSELEELKRKEKDFTNILSDCKTTKDYFKNKASKISKKRTNGVKDLIPFVGLVQGIKTGNLKRAIPFYSTAVAIKSVTSKDKEFYQFRAKLLQSQYDKLQGSISKFQSDLQKMKDYLENTANSTEQLNDACKYLDLEIKNSGKNLTDLRELNYFLKNLSNKYSFLKNGLETLNECIEENVLERQQIDSFSSDIQEVQKMFVKHKLLE